MAAQPIIDHRKNQSFTDLIHKQNDLYSRKTGDIFFLQKGRMGEAVDGILNSILDHAFDDLIIASRRTHWRYQSS